VTACAVIAVGTPVAIFALALSALTYFFARNRPARVARDLALGWGALMLLSPLLADFVSALFAPERLPAIADPTIVWGQIVGKDGLRTLIGHGFDAGARAVTAGYLPLSSPHSFLFEFWFELGIVGVCAAAFVIALVFQLAGSAPALIAPLLLAGLMSALLVSAFGVGLAPIWWVTFLALDALAFALVLHGHFRGRRPSVRDIDDARAPDLA
jgi:hypothetical protein